MAEFEKININDLKPADYNPRVMKEAERQKLKKNLKTFGLVDPIIIDLSDNNTIIGGHQRYDVLKEIDPEQDLKLIRLGDVGLVIKEAELRIKDKNDQKALNLSLNKISGQWDKNKLDNLLIELNTDNYILDLTGFDKLELMNNEIEFAPQLNTTDTQPRRKKREPTVAPPPLQYTEPAPAAVPTINEQYTPTFTEGHKEDLIIERLRFNSAKEYEIFKKYLEDEAEPGEPESRTINRLLNRAIHPANTKTYTVIFNTAEEKEIFNDLLKRHLNNPCLIPYLIKQGGGELNE